MKSLRVGLIGLGMMGRNHARILSNLKGVEFVGIVEPSLTDSIESTLEGIPFFPNPEKLLEQGLDYCVIAAPTGMHAKIATMVLKSKVNCLIEKPVAHDLQAAETIAAEAKKTKLLVGIGHIERYNAAIQQLKKKLRNNELGEVFQIATRRQGPFPARIGDVGVVKDLATHDLDLTMWLLESKFKSLSAETAFRSGRTHEDLVAITGKMQNGVVVNNLVNWLSPLKERTIIVTGEKGAFVVDTLSSDLTYYANGSHQVTQESIAHFKGVMQGDITQFSFRKPEPLLVEHENFRDKLLGKDAEIVTLQDGIEAVRVADAVIASGLSGKSVEL
jgi:predicted dehydrogenase